MFLMGLNLHSPVINDIGHLLLCLSATCNMSSLCDGAFCPFFVNIVCFLLIELLEFFIYSGHKPFVRQMFANIFHQSLQLVFYFTLRDL